MHVVILAAGRGKRLQPYTEVRPKCLMEVQDVTLLFRHLHFVTSLGADEVTVVTGHLSEMVDAEIRSFASSAEIKSVFNPAFQRGSIVSLLVGMQGIDDDVVFMDADVLYHPDVMRRLMQSAHPSCLLIDVSGEETGEEMMVGVRSDRAAVIARRVSHYGPFDVHGESVGFFKISREHVPTLVKTLEETIRSKGEDVEYEEALARFFDRVPVGHELVTDLPWTEIDFAEDLRRAREEIAPQLPNLIIKNVA